jgi:hypothetical protein
VGDILELLAVASEEDCPRSWSVADTDNVALEEWRSVWGWGKWLVVSAVAGRLIGNRRFVEA